MKITKLVKPLVEKIPGAARYYRYLRDLNSLATGLEFREELGFFFNGTPDMHRGEFEPEETAIVSSLLGSFELLVNIGANTGYYVCRALHSGVPVLAFEPNQLNINMLLRNVYANQFEANFFLFPIALSSKNGVLPMYGSATGASLIDGWAGQKNQYLVPVSKFDSVGKSLVDNKSCLVIIDIEGSELECLKGAETLLESTTDNVFLIEINVNKHQPDGISINPNLVETFEFMFTRGYKAFTADKNLRKVEIHEIRNIALSEINTLEVHNFIFLKQNESLNSIVF